MARYPRYGERYINIKAREPWTIRVLGVRYRDSVIIVNPEFYCEVRFIYESSGFYTEMPLSWFNAVYKKISGAPSYYRRPETETQWYTSLPDYTWLEDDNE